VLTDLWGGTPCNVALSLTRECSLGIDCAVVSGLNLAMLLEALAQRAPIASARELAEKASRAGNADIRSEG
jgi:PTS system mannose-specific IIB component